MTIRPLTVRNKVLEKLAVQVSEDNLEDVRKWIQDRLPEGGGTVYVRSGDDKGLLIPTIEGVRPCPVGWWVIRGVGGEVYPCEPEVFDQSYEVISV